MVVELKIAELLIQMHLQQFVAVAEAAADRILEAAEFLPESVRSQVEALLTSTAMQAVVVQVGLQLDPM